MVAAPAVLGMLLAGSISVAELVSVTDVSGLAVSPDGKTLVYREERPSLQTNRIETRWYAISTAGGASPRDLGDGGPARYTGPGAVANERPVWAADGHAIYVRKQQSGAVEIWRLGVDPVELVQVTHGDADVRAIALAPDGKSLLFSVEASRSEVRAEEDRLRAEGGRVTPAVDVALGLVGGVAGPDGPESARLTGDWFDRAPLLSERGVRHFRLKEDGSILPVARGPTISDYVFPDTDVVARVCGASDCRGGRIEATVRLGRRRWLLTFADAAERQKLAIWDGRRLRTIYRGTGLVNGSRLQYDPCAVHRRSAYCVLSAPDQPPLLARVDLVTGRVTTLLDPNAALRSKITGRAKRIVWRDQEAHVFEGVLIAPDGTPPAGGWPLVIHYYWCEGFLRGGQGDELPFYALAEQGIAGLCVNKPPISRPQPDATDDYRIALNGVTEIVRLLSKAGTIDAGRVGMQGLSFGSQVALWVARKTDLLRAVAVASGQIEPSSYWIYSDPGRDFDAVLRRTSGRGAPDETPGTWQKVAPALEAEQIRVPMLMQLPETEARWSMELFRRVQRSETPVELYAFPGAAHLKAAPRQRLAAMERNLACFALWLQDKILPSPTEPARGGRWEAMRRSWSLRHPRQP